MDINVYNNKFYQLTIFLINFGAGFYCGNFSILFPYSIEYANVTENEKLSNNQGQNDQEAQLSV